MLLVGDEGADHLPVANDQFLEAHALSDPAEPDRLEEVQHLRGYGTEAVHQLAAEAFQALLVGHLVQLAVQGQALAGLAHVAAGDQQFQVGLQHAVARPAVLRPLFVLEELLELLLLQFLHGLLQDAVVGLHADVVDEAALLGAQHVAGTADVEVLHGDVYAAAQVAELFDGLQAAARVGGQQVHAGAQQVAEGLAVAAAHAAPQLVQVAEAEVLRLVDDDRVGVGDVQPVLHDGGGHQHVRVALDEVQHDRFQLMPFQLPVPHGHAGAGTELAHHVRDVADVLHLVVHEVDLAAAAQFVLDGLLDGVLVEGLQHGLHRVAVGRRGADDAEVARAEQAELQRARDGRGGEGERVHRGAQGLQLVLHVHAELLLLVDDQQAQVLVHHVLAHQPVRADQDLDLPLLQVAQDLLLLLRAAEAVDVFHPHGQALHALLEALVVLQRQDGGGHQHGHLLAVAGGLEGGADGDLGLAEAHVAADQPVHGRAAFQVLLHVQRGLLLVGGVLVDEAGLQLVLQVVVRREGVAGLGLAFGVELDQVEGELLDLLLGALLQVLPRRGAQLAHLGLHALLRGVAAHPVQAVDAHVQDVLVAVQQPDGLLLLPVHVQLFQPAEHADAVIDVHHEIAGLQLGELLEGERLAVAAEALLQPEAVVALEDLVVGVQHQFPRRVDVAFVEVQHQGREAHLVLHVLEDGVQPLALLGVAAGDQVGVALGLPGVQVSAQRLEVLGEGRLRLGGKGER